MIAWLTRMLCWPSLPRLGAQMLLTLSAAWPTIAVIQALLQPFAGEWPLLVRALASALGMAVLMNAISLPIARRLLATRLGLQDQAAASACKAPGP
jgi:antibiotic biosynthesis monooxygenase (ABM) superfamily enzyme